MITKKVLLATDFSPSAQHLPDCLVELKVLGLDEIILLHVIDRRGPGIGVEGAVENAAREKLQDLQNKCGSRGIPARVVVTRGIPAEAIISVAQQEGVGLIIMAPHSKGIIRQILLGSTTAQVIRTSPVPVLVNKHYEPTTETASPPRCPLFHRVLVPLDFSAHSLNVLAQLPSWAQLIDEVILLTVIEGDWDSEELIRTAENRQILLAAREEELQAQGLRVQTMVRQGPAPLQILAIAEYEDVSLIMLATRGESLVKEVLLGSTANQVIRISPRPVMVFPSLPG